MREPNEFTVFIIPDDGRPQAYLANYPSSLSANYAYWFAWFLQISVTILAVWMFIRFRTYRDSFPCNLLPTNLHSGMIIGQPLVVFAYTHYHLLPDVIPCYMHCVFMFFPYLCFGWMGTASNFRNYVMYTAQGSLLKGDYTSRIVRLRNVIRSSNWFEATVAFFYLWLTALPNLLRLATMPQEIIVGPMWDLRCTSFTSPIFYVFTGISCLMIVVNVLSSHLSKNVKESYPFRYRYKHVSKWVARGLPFSQVPHYVKQFQTGIDRDVYNHISWIFLYIWACTYSFPFLFQLAYKVTRDASTSRFPPRQTSSIRSSANFNNSRRVAGKVSEEDAILAGLLQNPTNTAELKSMLTSSDTRVNEAFAEYLQRELCVENILFANAVKEFSNVEALSMSGKKGVLAIAQKYLLVGSACEVNVSDGLRRATLKQIESTLQIQSVARVTIPDVVDEGKGGNELFIGPYPERDVFAACEDQIYRVMLEPFQRFVRKTKMV